MNGKQHSSFIPLFVFLYNFYSVIYFIQSIIESLIIHKKTGYQSFLPFFYYLFDPTLVLKTYFIISLFCDSFSLSESKTNLFIH